MQPVGIYPKKYDWAGTTAFGMAGIPSQHIGGDCSLYVRAATIDFDDGEWECQVTASDFAAQDALTSAPVQLVVRGKFWKETHKNHSQNEWSCEICVFLAFLSFY